MANAEERMLGNVDLPICEVTLLEDRARVLRRGLVTLESGIAGVLIDAVAPTIADKTLLVRVKSGEAKVADASVRRRLVVQRGDSSADPDSVAGLTARGEELERNIKSKLDRKSSLEAEAASLQQLAVRTLVEISEDVAWGRAADSSNWRSSLGEVSKRERAAREELTAVSRKLEELYAENDRLVARLAEMSDPSQSRWAGIEVSLESELGGEIEMEVEYVVPGACWRPLHSAWLNSEAKLVSFSTDACVWQNTGEDWTGVALRFSTERASLGSSPPRLSSDVLRVQKRSAQVVVETREQEVQTTGLGVAIPASRDLPGIDDGGELVSLDAKRPADVPSDGRPHRVRIGGFSTECELALVAMPELSRAVLLRSILSNQSSTPILAGPVELIRDSGYVGRTSVLFVAPGEQFELGWGPDAELRIHRRADTFPEKSRMLSSWVSRRHRIEVFASNIGGSTRTIEVTERMPVSEIDKVKIELAEKSEGGVGPDERGFVSWTLTLEPFSQAQRVLEFLQKKHEDVVGL